MADVDRAATEARPWTTRGNVLVMGLPYMALVADEIAAQAVASAHNTVVERLGQQLHEARFENERLRFDRDEAQMEEHDLAVENDAVIAERNEARAERDVVRQQLAAVDRRMRERHAPRTAEVYSEVHYENDHDSEDERCSEACFVSEQLCSACGSAVPCLEIRQWDKTLAAAAVSVQPEPQETKP